MFNHTHVELDENQIPLVSRFDEFADTYLMCVLAMLFYLAPLTLGLHYDDFLMRSPLVKFVAAITGFVASAIAWVPAFLIAGLVLGKFDFAKEVFRLYSSTDFSVAMALVFLAIPIAGFLARTINRIASSYLHRKLIFCAAVILSMTGLASTVEYTNALRHQAVYICSCSIIGIIYFLLVVKNARTRRTRIGPGPV